jgi:8-oxo-dGTP pyrophosphatase MutT (NUDIX family)
MKYKKFNNIPNEEVTLVDGRTIWLSRSVAVVSQVIAIDKKNDKFYALIVKRGPASMGSIGLWCFPCGYLDFNETTAEAAIRETWEESGIDLSSLKLLNEKDLEPWYVDSNPNHPRQNVSIHHRFVISSEDGFDLPLTSINNCESGEIDEVRWVEVSEIYNGKYKMAFKHEVVMKSLVDKIFPFIPECG